MRTPRPVMHPRLCQSVKSQIVYNSIQAGYLLSSVGNFCVAFAGFSISSIVGITPLYAFPDGRCMKWPKEN